MSRPTSPLVMIAGVGAAAVATVGFVLYRLSRTISCTREALHQRVSELEADSQRRLDRIQRGAERSMALNRVHELEPSRVELAALPTPTISLSLPWLQDAFVTLKMDSDTGCELSGNKVRKLEYILDDAVRRGATCVITCGGPQSNHARATVVAARRLGLVPHVVLRRPDDERAARATGNLFLMDLCGARITWIDPAEYVHRDAIMKRLAGELRKDGVKAYCIPEGGSNALGCWGYVRMVAELLDDKGEVPFDVLALGVGSAGTLAGVLIARALLGLSSQFDVCGFVVSGSPDVHRAAVVQIVDEFRSSFKLPELVVGEYYLFDSVGGGYGVLGKDDVAVIREIAETCGVLLDGTYAGKAMATMLGFLRKPASARPAPLHNSSICFVHTGGIFGLYAKPEPFFA